MSDLFGNMQPKVGQSNAQFLAHLANGMSTEALRAKAKAEWPDLNNTYARAWLGMRGK